ncbi:hypothetical protein BC827DRAFT_513595 [Russula dissimulans]|nr:hypothetical protein BC827DRAFT_513595 [Russula dissimulans]
MASSLSHGRWAVPQHDQDTWVYPEGEIPAISTASGKDDNSRLWALPRVNTFLLEDPDGRNSWKYVYAVLLDNYFVLLETKTRGTGKTKTSHVMRPIPLECLRLGDVNFNDHLTLALQGRKKKSGMFNRIRSGGQPPAEYHNSFTIYHAYSTTSRQYTLWTEYPSAVNIWSGDLWDAIQERKNKVLLYTHHVLDEGFFCVPAGVPLTHGTHITGHVLCIAEFSFQGTHYLVVGCTNGIYARHRVNDSPFRRVLEIKESISIVAVPEFNEFLVHYESALYSYPLDLIVQISRGDATPESLDDSKERLAQGRGDVLFMKVGCVFDRTLIVYAAKNEQVTLHVLELAHRNENRQTPGDRATYCLWVLSVLIYVP